MDFYAISTFWLFGYTFLCGCIFLLLLGIYIEVELLGPMVILCLTYRGIVRLFSMVPVAFYIPISNVQGFQFLHSLANTWHFLDFKILAILMSVREMLNF